MKYGKLIEIEKSSLLEPIAFVCKGVSDDITRYFMNFVYCEDNKLIATDGKRLHLLELKENPFEFKDKTFYRVLKATKSVVWLVEVIEDMQFSNWKRVMPEGEHKTTEMTFSKMNIFLEIAKLFRATPEDTALNLDYLKDLPEYQRWTVSIYEESKAIKFESNNMTAIIMSMRETE